MRGRWIISAAILAATTFSNFAGATPATTVIQDTLFRADGTRFNGIVNIEWKSFTAADGTQIPQNLISVPITNGYLRVELVPTTNALEPMYYTATFNSEGRTQFTEYWSVPPTSVALRLTDVRTHGPVASPITSPSSPIAIQDVSGLRTELDLRPARGSSWVTSRTAVISEAGALDGAIGNPGDCIHVDGTSGPCGGGGLLFVDGETPSGVIDGVNVQFGLSAPPYPSSSLALYLNGMLMRQGVEYTLQGTTVLFASGRAPQMGQSLQAWYRLASNATVTIDIAGLEVLAGAVDGVNRNFMLAGVPMPASSLQLFRNGLLQKAGVDFTLSVSTITFADTAVPQPGDILQAIYRK